MYDTGLTSITNHSLREMTRT